MKMRVIARKTLREYWESPGHGDAEQPLKAWLKEAEYAAWKKPTEIKQKYSSASILRNSRVVFNIAGNKYRLVVKIHYNTGIVYIRFIGTHPEYDLIDAETI